MPPSDADAAAIHVHPIGDGLDSFRAIFQSSFPDLNPTDVSRFDEQLSFERGERDPAGRDWRSVCPSC